MNNQIEEIKRIIDERCEAELGQVHASSKGGKVTKTVDTSLIAKDIYNVGYQKVDKDSIIINKEEYERITKELVTEQRAKEIAQEYFRIVRKETAEKIYSLYAEKVDRVILELKADFNTKTFNTTLEKTIKESLMNTQIETLIITKNGVKEFAEKFGAEVE